MQHQALRFTPVWAQKLVNSAKLNGHQGCVNRLAWNEDGSLLASGSDDRQVCILVCCASGVSNTRCIKKTCAACMLCRYCFGRTQMWTEALWHYRQTMLPTYLACTSCPAPTADRSSQAQWMTQSCYIALSVCLHHCPEEALAHHCLCHSKAPCMAAIKPE